MSLSEQLRRIRAKSAEGMSTEMKDRMRRGKEAIRSTGLRERVLGVGARAPLFARPDHNGRTVRLESVLSRGPVILSFYRGKW